MKLASSVLKSSKGKYYYLDLTESKYGNYVRVSCPFTNYTVNAGTLKVHRSPGVYRDMPKNVWNEVLELLKK
jgi:hypothetical protein